MSTFVTFFFGFRVYEIFFEINSFFLLENRIARAFIGIVLYRPMTIFFFFFFENYNHVIRFIVRWWHSMQLPISNGWTNEPMYSFSFDGMGFLLSKTVDFYNTDICFFIYLYYIINTAGSIICLTLCDICQCLLNSKPLIQLTIDNSSFFWFIYWTEIFCFAWRYNRLCRISKACVYRHIITAYAKFDIVYNSTQR